MRSSSVERNCSLRFEKHMANGRYYEKKEVIHREWHAETPKNLRCYEVLRHIIVCEVDYQTKLSYFIENILNPIKSRDSITKRKLLDHNWVISSCKLIHTFLDISLNFTNQLTAVEQASDFSYILTAYENVSQNLNLMKDYIKDCCNCLHTCNSYSEILYEELNMANKPNFTPFDGFIILPLQQYPFYQIQLNELISALHEDNLGHMLPDLIRIGENIYRQTSELDALLAEQKDKFQLLELQYQFVGNAAVYKEGRSLVKEGLLEQVQVYHGEHYSRLFHCFLFNDAFMFCNIVPAQDIGTGNIEGAQSKYKVVGMIEFCPENDLRLSPCEREGVSHGFLLKGGAFNDVFRASSEEECASWIVVLEGVIGGHCSKNPRPMDKSLGSGLKAVVSQLEQLFLVKKPKDSAGSRGEAREGSSKLPTKVENSTCRDLVVAADFAKNTTNNRSDDRSSRLSQTASHPILVQLKSLLKILRSQVFHLDVLRQVLVLPIRAALQGAVLTVAATGGWERGDEDDDNMSSASGSSGRSSSRRSARFGLGLRSSSSERSSASLALSRSPSALASMHELLDDEETHSFLEALESLFEYMKTFTAALGDRIRSADPNDMASFEGIFEHVLEALSRVERSRDGDGDGADKVFHESCIGFASHCSWFLRALNDDVLKGFLSEVQKSLSPRSLDSYVLSIPGGLKRILLLLERTRETLSAHEMRIVCVEMFMGKYSDALSAINDLMSEQETPRNIENMRMTAISANDPLLERILYEADSQRRFLREGDIVKVCRNDRKKYHFWLLSDFLIYGSVARAAISISGSVCYKVHRIIALSNCDVQPSKASETVGVDTLSCYCLDVLSSEKSFTVAFDNDEDCQEWFYDLRTAIAANKRLASSQCTFAPVWNADSKTDSCICCNQEFGMLTRRHHCRKCGHHVCSLHSKHRAILENISLTAEQRVCDKCFEEISKPKAASNKRTPHRGFRAATADSSLSITPPKPPPRPIQCRSREISSSYTQGAVESQALVMPSLRNTYPSTQLTPFQSDSLADVRAPNLERDLISAKNRPPHPRSYRDLDRDVGESNTCTRNIFHQEVKHELRSVKQEVIVNFGSGCAQMEPCPPPPPPPLPRKTNLTPTAQMETSRDSMLKREIEGGMARLRPVEAIRSDSAKNIESEIPMSESVSQLLNAAIQTRRYSITRRSDNNSSRGTQLGDTSNGGSDDDSSSCSSSGFSD